MPSIERLYELIRAVASEADANRLLERVLDAAMEISRAERGCIVLADGAIRTAASRHWEGAISRTVLARVLASERPVVLRDGELTSASLVSQRVRAVCAVPLRTPAGAIGAVYLDHRSDPRIFDELDLLSAVGAQAAIAIERTSRPRTAQPRIIVGDSGRMREVLRLVEKMAPLPYPVLIEGESGTGKELVARALHRRGPFVAANAGAIPGTLFESEMFGHVRGAFTGADEDRAGLFEQADGGTLFLDEVHSLTPELQEKLLRVLQEREVRRVGDTKSIPIRVRLVVATNESLETPNFRQDLYHRLNVLRILLPPLRERLDDLPLLTDHFLCEIRRETGRVYRLSAGAAAALERYVWPGNVRELENSLRRAAALSDHEILDASDFSFLGFSPSPLRSVEDYIRDTCARYGACMTVRELAERLGVHRKTLWKLRRKWGQV